MKESDEYYIKNLYPFQDGILSIVIELGLPFYLTGETALSRHYFNHRYSDDIDLFINNDHSFSEHTDLFYTALLKKQKTKLFNLDEQRTRKSENYLQLFINQKGIDLKVDIVNDVAPHYGKLIINDNLGKIDSLRNILSNKLSALFRYEPKDIADIWIICKNLECDFREIINETLSKEVGVDPVAIYEILSTFPMNKLSLIKWRTEPESEVFKKEIQRMAEDILYGRKNSLCC